MRSIALLTLLAAGLTAGGLCVQRTTHEDYAATCDPSVVQDIELIPSIHTDSNEGSPYYLRLTLKGDTPTQVLYAGISGGHGDYAVALEDRTSARPEERFAGSRNLISAPVPLSYEPLEFTAAFGANPVVAQAARCTLTPAPRSEWRFVGLDRVFRV
ncbi:hypothetical protein [Cognatilysobacter terrigena]|uniref:hypothetical protein n=1 Tax=Cognatilysobacter terrigena TaxID=2488749 RepID=UPI00106127E9|nr:hypothetical protein [Lysobacter terrigena]